jgi:hypothetical protein
MKCYSQMIPGTVWNNPQIGLKKEALLSDFHFGSSFLRVKLRPGTLWPETSALWRNTHICYPPAPQDHSAKLCHSCNNDGNTHLLALWLQVLLIKLKYRQYSAIADLHTSHSAVEQALVFFVFTSRFLVSDVNTETSTVSHISSITHKWSLLIARQVFTRQTFRGYLPPKTQNCHLKTEICEVKVTLRLTVS